MNFKNIDKWSFGYAIVRGYVKFAHDLIFYRKIIVKGKENIPKDAPLFFAPNHQNALMDALIVLFSRKQQITFIARADIFKNKTIAKLLIFFKILPAYRIRDGKENLKKNEEIFNISVKILENNNILALFPEASHADKRQLKILKKGVQRIVFQAEEKNNYQLGVKIVPIGIYYSNYWNMKSDVQIWYGKPIEIDEYLKIYQENEQKAMLGLRDRLTEELKPLTINIKNKEYYELFEFMREVYNKRLRESKGINGSFDNRFKTDQEIIEKMDKAFESEPETIEQLNKEATVYKRKLKKLKIKHWVVDKNEGAINLIGKSLLLIAMLPVFLYGYINNLIPYSIPKLITGKLKDKQFTSSVVLILGIITFPLFYLIQFLLVWIFTDIWWIKFAYLISLPFMGVLAFYIHRFFVKTKAQWMFLFTDKAPLNKDKDKIYDIMDEIVKKY